MNKFGRSQATKLLLDRITDQPILAGVGGATYDLYGVTDRDRNLYTWGSMGQISSMGLGLAIARPDLKVVVLDGDGALLMNLGSLATIARKAPPNLVHLVWDDEVYETTGGQPTHTRVGTDLAGIAKAAGIPHAVAVADAAGLVAALDRALTEAGPWFIAVKVSREKATARPPRDPIFFKYRFMRAIEAPLRRSSRALVRDCLGQLPAQPVASAWREPRRLAKSPPTPLCERGASPASAKRTRQAGADRRQSGGDIGRGR